MNDCPRKQIMERRHYEHPPLETTRLSHRDDGFHGTESGYWRTHKWLRPFGEAGVLDFARFDVERDEQR